MVGVVALQCYQLGDVYYSIVGFGLAFCLARAADATKRWDRE
jgi:hypothetical protein